MKNARKAKIAIISILIIGMLVMLTGCGNKEENTQNNEKTENVKNEQTQNEKQDEISNAGEFVKYGNNIYFWKLKADSRTDTGIGAEYMYNSEAENELMKMDEKGNQATILNGKGAGNILIANDILFYQQYTDNNDSSKICSINLNGEDQKEICEGKIVSVTDKSIVGKNNDGLFLLDTKTNEITKTSEPNTEYVNTVDNSVYYDVYNEKTGELKLGLINDGKDSGIIQTFFKKELFADVATAPLEISELGEKDGKIIFYICYRGGSGNFIQDEKCYVMEKDGTNLQEYKTNSDNISDGDETKTLEGIFMNYDASTGKRDLTYIDNATKEKKIILSSSEINEKFGFKSGEEYLTSIAESKQIGNDLYITLDNSNHDSENDIGWRYSYKRAKTVCFKYNTETKEITELYNF